MDEGDELARAHDDLGWTLLRLMRADRPDSHLACCPEVLITVFHDETVPSEDVPNGRLHRICGVFSCPHEMTGTLTLSATTAPGKPD